VVKAAFIGVPMPLCSCGVVPTVIALKKKGASHSSCLSFLVSTPQTGVDSLLVSASFLSWPFALFKLVSAFVIGILGGVIHLILQRKHAKTKRSNNALPDSESSTSHPRPGLKALYDFAINDLFYNLWRWMFAGIVVAALISTFVSDELLSQSFFADPVYGSIAALFLSIPLYVCATSSVPIAAALVLKGMSPAVAIVFLIAGPATNIATIGLIYKSFGKLFTGVYLASVSIGSIVCAIFFGSVITIHLPDVAHHHGGSNGLEFAGAVLFSLMLVSFFYKDLKAWIVSKRAPATESVTFFVDGMSCQGCVGKIRHSILDQKLGVQVTGDTEAKTLTVAGSRLEQEKIITAIVQCGFTMRE
jgi:uncharacterized membrane protein YraQ (UPF0718 family)/copper chaperone CopZ